MKTRVAVIFGGKSVEHEVSVISGIQVVNGISKERYEVIPVYLTKENELFVGDAVGDIESYKDVEGLLKKSRKVELVKDDGFKLRDASKKLLKKSLEVDVVFPVVHGMGVEDGTLQGWLKMIGVPYVGSDVCSSAVGMNKHYAKLVVNDVGVPILESKMYTATEVSDLVGILDDADQIGYPIIVKPANLGSSVGIKIANNESELTDALDEACEFSTRVVIERAITNLREINCAVTGDDIVQIVSECEEPLHFDEILSYEDKYVGGSKGGSKGMMSTQRILPANITKEQKEKIQEMAIKSFKALGCNGVARIDFLLDEDNGEIFFNEINTIPGSLSFYLWEAYGISFESLLNRMIQYAFDRDRAEKDLEVSFDTNILSQANLNGTKGVKR